MELTYTERRIGYEKGKKYANPRYFSDPRSWATRVVIEGRNYPNIVAAYEALGVPVQVVSNKPLEPEPAPPLNAAGVEIPSDWQSLPWSRPSKPGGLTLRGLVKAIGGTAVNTADAHKLIQRAIDGDV